jgi:cytoskeletal protein CcmA (bactofilin family)
VVKSFLSEDLIIDGNIISKGDLEIKGTVTGDISAESISVLDLGKVHGGLKGQDVIIDGSVNGHIHADDLTVSSSANISADITYVRIATEKGAQISGKLALKS